MRIWRQNMVAIVPLFLCLALAISGLVYHFVKRELVRGLREESQGAVLSIAAFSGQFFSGERSIEAIEQSVDRALSYGSILRATVQASDQSGAPLIDRGDQQLSADFPEDGDLDLASPFKTSDGRTVISATAPIMGAGDVEVGRVVVYMDANRMPQGLAEVTRISMIGTLLTVIIGVFASGLVSLALRKEMEPLECAVAAIAKGSNIAPAENTENARGIREIIDLRNTVATMGSVLDWTMHKSRLLATSPSAASIAEDSLPGSRLLVEQGAEGVDVEVHLLPVNQSPAEGAFLACWRTAGGELIAFFGGVDSSGDSVERQMRAHAVVHYLQARLSTRCCRAAEILQRCTTLFGVRDLTMIRCDVARAQAFEVFRLRADGMIDHESTPKSRGMHLFHNGGRHHDALFDGLTHSLPALSAAELARRATVLLDRSSQSAGVVIGSIVFDPKPSVADSGALSRSSLATSVHA